MSEYSSIFPFSTCDMSEGDGWQVEEESRDLADHRHRLSPYPSSVLSRPILAALDRFVRITPLCRHFPVVLALAVRFANQRRAGFCFSPTLTPNCTSV